MLGLNLVSHGKYGFTVIYISTSHDGYTPIPFPEHTTNGNSNPIDILHGTAVTVSVDHPIRGRNEMAILNIYKSSNMKPSALHQLHFMLQHVRTFMQDNSPNIIITGDFNSWTEIIGFNPIMRIKRPRKFKEGDKLVHFVVKRNSINFTSRDPTMWKKRKNNEITEYLDQNGKLSKLTLGNGPSSDNASRNQSANYDQS